MRKWGIVITLVYALIVLGLLVPVFVTLLGGRLPLSPDFYKTVRTICGWWGLWMPVAVVLAGQAALLFLSVDTSFKRLKPRSHIVVSCVAASMLFALLTFAGLSSLEAAAFGDRLLDRYWASAIQVLSVWGILWVLWGILFYLYFRNSLEITTRAVSWLLKGSVLELLVAVPCHILVRRRDDCSAPIATSFGIVTGIAVMLLSFGPSVLLLYKKRMDAYAARGAR
jgi:hypothetical protein